jgi:hypothetical protein
MNWEYIPWLDFEKSETRYNNRLPHESSREEYRYSAFRLDSFLTLTRVLSYPKPFTKFVPSFVLVQRSPWNDAQPQEKQKLLQLPQGAVVVCDTGPSFA